MNCIGEYSVAKYIKIFLLLIAVVAIFFGIGELKEKLLENDINNEIVYLREYSVLNEKVTDELDGFKIMLISALHEAPFSTQIIEHINYSKPDIIVFGGDMIQLPETKVSETVKIAKEFSHIPMYSVSGNHESQSGKCYDILAELSDYGVTPIDNRCEIIDVSGVRLCLIGLADPIESSVKKRHIKHMKETLAELLLQENDFSVLINHRAYLYPDLKDSGVDLILSGDYHGGIIRLPLVGGVIGHYNDNNLFPEYDYGHFKEENSADLIVSGGCDKNPEKKRYFNPPEVLTITLKKG